MIEHKNVETFAASLRGALLEPGQPGYDEGRVLWNGMMDKRSALIARCEGVADVIAAVNLQQHTPRRARWRTQRCGLRCRPFAWGLAKFRRPHRGGEGDCSTKWDFGFDIFHRRQGNHPHQLLGFGLAGPVGRELIEDTTLVAEAFVGTVTICTGVDCRLSIDWYPGSRWF